MAKLPRPPGAVRDQIILLFLAAGVVSVPLIRFEPPVWARFALLGVFVLLVLYSLAAAACPEVEAPPDLHRLLRSPARTPRGFQVLAKELVVDVAARGGRRRACVLRWRLTIQNVGNDALHAVRVPILTDVPIWGDELPVNVWVDGVPSTQARLDVSDHYAPVATIYLAHSGLPVGGRTDVEYEYRHEALARVDADTWILDLLPVIRGGSVRLSVRFSGRALQQGSAYVVRRRGVCLRRVTLGAAESHHDSSISSLTVAYQRKHGDSYLVLDTEAVPQPRRTLAAQGTKA